MADQAVPFRDGMVAGATAWAVGVMLVAVGLLLFGSQLSFGLSVLIYSTFHLWPTLIFGPTIEAFVFSLIPMAILAVTGYQVASTSGTTEWLPVGAAVAAGYFPVAALSHIVVFVAGGMGSLVVALFAMVFSGFVFPIVFAGLGGTFAAERGDG